MEITNTQKEFTEELEKVIKSVQQSINCENNSEEELKSLTKVLTILKSLKNEEIETARLLVSSLTLAFPIIELEKATNQLKRNIQIKLFLETYKTFS